jgi:Flp pilus assembly protein TadG
MAPARATSGERGAAAVEFAILLPVLVAILLGTIDWGYYFFTREIVVNASREGARTGTLQVAGVDAEAEAKKAAQTYLDNTLKNASTATISTGTEARAGCQVLTSSCVRIEYPAGSVTGFLAKFVPKTITAYAEMRR